MTTLPPNDGAAEGTTPGTAADGTAAPQPNTQPPVAPPAAAPQYEAPHAGAYQQPYQAAPANEAATTIALNYWLSVFFTWIPALIFYIVEKGKGNTPALKFHIANLNFSLIRTGIGVAGGILASIPYIGLLIALLLGVASVVFFVFHIIAAAKAADSYRRGGAPEFIVNFPLVK